MCVFSGWTTLHVCTSVALIIEPHDIGTLLKGQFTPKSKTHIFPLTCNTIYPSRLFWCELSSFGYITQNDACICTWATG